MANRKQNPVSQSVPRPVNQIMKEPELEWGGFIDLRLNSDEKAAVEQWGAAFDGEIWAWVLDAVGKGLKFGLSFDRPNNTFVASFNGQGALTIQKRFSLTSRAGSADEAIKLLAYKHFVLLREDWGNFKPSGSNIPNWG